MSEQDHAGPSGIEREAAADVSPADVVVHVVRVFTTADGSLGNPLGIITNPEAFAGGSAGAAEVAPPPTVAANPAGPTGPAAPRGPVGPTAPGAPAAGSVVPNSVPTAAPVSTAPAPTPALPPWHGLEQQIAAHLGFSETVFIDSYEDQPGARSFASIRIFTPTRELPFAGHPTVGTAWWLREHGSAADVIVVPAGDVGVRFEGDVAWVSARASWVHDFHWMPLDSLAEVEALEPSDFSSGHHYAYAWSDEATGSLRARMFAAEGGVSEDEATGAAAVALTARLGRDLDITQGEGSRISTHHLGDELIEVGGMVAEDLGVSVHIQ